MSVLARGRGWAKAAATLLVAVPLVWVGLARTAHAGEWKITYSHSATLSGSEVECKGDSDDANDYGDGALSWVSGSTLGPYVDPNSSAALPPDGVERDTRI